MHTVLIIMAVGIGVGYLMRSRKTWLQYTNKATLWIIFLLLFFMGIGVGNNPQIMENLDTIGFRGLQLALVAILGSVVLSWVVYRLFFKSADDER
ncbi:MAG: DUF340 domain-containing protein [Bacteroidetes bacterium HGW-Bacteroidetes-4]|nr:MAG: DUF340 domain-containing protein [Bacteroidetes bacterium HGW-Bacteroidetes-4]